jgi:hypothetical protein
MCEPLPNIVVEWSRVQISDRRPATMDNGFCGFSQSLQANAGIVS